MSVEILLTKEVLDDPMGREYGFPTPASRWLAEAVIDDFIVETASARDAISAFEMLLDRIEARPELRDDFDLILKEAGR